MNTNVDGNIKEHNQLTMLLFNHGGNRSYGIPYFFVSGSFAKDAAEHLGGFTFDFIDIGFHFAISIKITENVAIFQFRYNLRKRHIGVVKSTQFLSNLLHIDRIA